MKQIRDAIVIGSGIIGSAIALAVVRAGVRRVTLIEKGPLVSGMTRRSAGLVHPFQADPLSTELAAMSYDLYRQWAITLPGKSSFVETGAAVLARQASDASASFATWKQSLAEANEIGPGGLAAVFPGVTTHTRGALFTPHAGYADAVLTAQAIVKAAKDQGLETQTGTQVKQILARSHQIHGVKTTTGELEAPIVIVAAGGWTERLLAPLGVALHLRARRGSLLFYEQPREQTTEFPMLLDAGGSYFVRPHPYRMLSAGSISAETQTQGVDALDEYVPATEAAAVNRVIGEWVSPFANLTPKRSHTMLYFAANDGLPAFGRVTTMTGLYVAAGFGPGAFSVAPAVGETLARMVVDGESPRDISSFDPLRATLRT
ncbi:MAG: FAD-binding oxidoreductase [Anaerolineae bacterium]|nr:FAD-binding oxidoreductase [Anaerolineae bacterium]